MNSSWKLSVNSHHHHPKAMHTVAIWTFTFHKISGFVRVILKANFKQFCRPKVSIFFIWKFTFIILIFLLVFAEFVKSTAFYTLLLIFQRVDISNLWFLHQNAIQACQLFEIAATVCKKQWIWQILQKLEGKWE